MTDSANEDWIIKPAYRPAGGVKSTITEYVGAKLAQRMGMPVPDHEVLYLSTKLIANESELSNFGSGLVVGSRYEEGLDLAMVEQRLKWSTVAGGVLGNLRGHNYHNTIGIMVGDTWMANGDRSLGILGPSYAMPGHNTQNLGNLYFKLVENTKNEYVIRGIDFGHLFWGNTWGVGTSQTQWPDVIFGAMSFFFKIKLLTQDYNNHAVDCQSWINDILRLDFQKEFRQIVNEIPSEWLIGMTGVSQSLGSADWDDLMVRLEQRRNVLNSIMVNTYQATAARYRTR
ncbi:hypothetical protein Q0M94_03330 [Deinococcus radiomollis]|uniref:HipA family kinase n=1 Tax=Deinococcus radiomollis TaxID=468916 RepID=UPI003892A650